jgi:hypothetical protein
MPENLSQTFCRRANAVDFDLPTRGGSEQLMIGQLNGDQFGVPCSDG